MKDRRGAEIHIGDLAVHASSGRYGAYDIVRVSGFTAKMVQVDAVDYTGFTRDWPTFPGPTITNLNPSSLIVANLPHVEGRLNN